MAFTNIDLTPKLTTNSTLEMEYENETIEFQVTWKGKHIEENQELINEIMIHAFKNNSIEIPKMSMYYNYNYTWATEVVFSEQYGLYAKYNLDTYKAKEYMETLYPEHYEEEECIDEFANNSYVRETVANNKPSPKLNDSKIKNKRFII